MPGLKPQPSPHSEHSGPACHLSRGLRRYFETTYPGYFLPVSLCVTPALPLSHKEISVAGQKAELGSGANGYYMDPGRGAARQPGLQTRIANARQFSFDLTKYALTILVTDPGRGGNIMPRDRAWTRARGMSFFL